MVYILLFNNFLLFIVLIFFYIVDFGELFGFIFIFEKTEFDSFVYLYDKLFEINVIVILIIICIINLILNLICIENFCLIGIGFLWIFIVNYIMYILYTFNSSTGFLILSYKVYIGAYVIVIYYASFIQI